jgi:mannose-1-phosphate guanylyltransferase
MVPIMNVPFLERALSRIREAGIDHIILPAGYLPEAITSHFGDGSSHGLRLTFVIEETPLGTAGALKNVEQYIDGPFFVFNGDVLTSLDLRAMMAYHREKGGSGTLHLIRVEDPSQFGAVVHDENCLIQAFLEKPPAGTSPTNEVNAGTYLLEREVLDAIPAGRNVSIERETFPQLIANGKKLYAFTTGDYWIDLGRPENYLDAHRHIFDGAVPLGLEFTTSGYPPATLIEPVYVGNNVSIESGAVVGPYVVLGDGCRVHAGASIKDSVLWDEVVVGPGASIESAIVASRAQIGAAATVRRGSVIGHDAVIEEGATLDEGARVAGDRVVTG